MDLPIEDYPTYKKAASKLALKAEVRKANFKKIGIAIFEKAIEGLGSKEEDWLIPFFENFTKEGLCPADKTLEIFKNCGGKTYTWIKTILKEEDY